MMYSVKRISIRSVAKVVFILMLVLIVPPIVFAYHTGHDIF